MILKGYLVGVIVFYFGKVHVKNLNTLIKKILNQKLYQLTQSLEQSVEKDIMKMLSIQLFQMTRLLSNRRLVVHRKMKQMATKL